MNKFKSALSFLMLITMVLFPIMSQASAEEDLVQDPSAKSKQLKVMSYNLRYASASGPDSWGDRRPVMAQLLDLEKPDIIGTQEGLFHQLKDMEEDMPQYDWIGEGRRGGSKSEYMAVFYNKKRFSPLEYDHYWLSDTPNVIGSTTWGEKWDNRMVTWVKFMDKKTKQEFYFVNTHLDQSSAESREKSAKLIVEKLSEFEPHLPVIVTGDFNSKSNSIPYHTIINDGGFTDAWTQAETRIGENLGTFNGLKDPTGGGPGNIIDFIFYKGNLKVKQAKINDYTKNGQFPSDHFPVIADLAIEPSQYAENLALNKTTIGTTACNQAETAGNAFDGTIYNNSKFCSKTVPAFVQVDLGSPQAVSDFVIKHAGQGGENPGLNTKDFNIEVSEDGTNWTRVVEVTGNTSNTTLHEISQVSARYVKLNVENAGSDNVTRIYEFEIYNN
ncbi:discoidin domain-containing protein [Neobacillus niacini]|uniref:galactose-binding domain-containing protein n=1 Tax=Neobacillus niacini TaxID=86668 RepID=UPI002FFE36CC